MPFGYAPDVSFAPLYAGFTSLGFLARGRSSRNVAGSARAAGCRCATCWGPGHCDASGRGRLPSHVANTSSFDAAACYGGIAGSTVPNALPTAALLPPLTGFVSREFDATLDHWGVDLAVPPNTAVAAPADGVVVLAEETVTGGKTVVLQHTHGLTTVFKHNTRLLVRTGERVRAGTIVALSGNTGEWTTGPHLHYEVWQDGEPVDPKPFLAPW